MKPSLLLFCLFPIWLARADRASLGMYVEDAQSGAPLSPTFYVRLDGELFSRRNAA